MVDLSVFVIRKVQTGFKFDLKAPNGEIVLTSEVYTSAAACRKGIGSAIRSVAAAGELDLTGEAGEKVPNPRFELYQDKAGRCRFRLRARNGAIVAVSEGYSNRAGCLGGITSVRKNAPEAEIVEE